MVSQMKSSLAYKISPILWEGQLTKHGLWEAAARDLCESIASELTPAFSRPHRRRRPGILADGAQGCAGFAIEQAPG